MGYEVVVTWNQADHGSESRLISKMGTTDKMYTQDDDVGPRMYRIRANTQPWLTRELRKMKRLRGILFNQNYWRWKIAYTVQSIVRVALSVRMTG